MVKANLVSMSVEGLLQLHDDIGNILSQKASQLQSQLAALGDGGLAPAAANSGGQTPHEQDEGQEGRAQVPQSEKQVRDLGGAWQDAVVACGRNQEGKKARGLRHISEGQKGAAKKRKTDEASRARLSTVGPLSFMRPPSN